MEQEPKEKAVGEPGYKVRWHQEIKKDLSKITPSTVETLVRIAEHRLPRGPQLIGQPLKGTVNLLWRIRFSKYRIVYTLNAKAKEVWVLSVQGRNEVYRHSHIQSMLRLAVALHEQLERGR